MIIFKNSATISEYLKKVALKGKSVGFCPTMGALHEGHISLIGIARQKCDLVVCSIFINPTQFNDPKDFEKYPVTIESDILMLEEAGCDLLFLPPVEEIYPPGGLPAPKYEIGYLETVLEGRYRPGHFQGVCQVIDRLLHIVAPQSLFLGQKDFQQCMVIKKLVITLGLRVEIEVCPTKREADGLAMSSRNRRLSDSQRKIAPALFEVLTRMSTRVLPGSLQPLKDEFRDYLTNLGFKVDYVEIAKSSNLDIVNLWDGREKLVGLVAASLGATRLIDNRLLN